MAMEPHSAVSVDLLEEALEELSPVLLAVVDGVFALAPQDGQELGPGLEKAAAFADGLEGAIEADRTGAVTVPQEPAVLGGDAAHVGPLETGREGLGFLVGAFDRTGCELDFDAWSDPRRASGDDSLVPVTGVLPRPPADPTRRSQ